MDFLGLGSIASAVGNYFSTKETNKANVGLQREAQAYATDMWNKQNEYNTPLANMTRLQQAGLNPNLAYGNIGESRAANPTTVSPAHLEAPQIDGSSIAQYQQVKNAQTYNLRQNIDIETAKANALRAASDADYTVWENEKLKSSGTLKSDPTLIKQFQRGTSVLGDYVGGVLKRLQQRPTLLPLQRHAGPDENAHEYVIPANSNQMVPAEEYDGGQ